MIPVLELEKSGDARFGNSDSRLGTYEKNYCSRKGYMHDFLLPKGIHAVCMAFSWKSVSDLETVIPIREH